MQIYRFGKSSGFLHSWRDIQRELCLRLRHLQVYAVLRHRHRLLLLAVPEALLDAAHRRYSRRARHNGLLHSRVEAEQVSSRRHFLTHQVPKGHKRPRKCPTLKAFRYI